MLSNDNDGAHTIDDSQIKGFLQEIWELGANQEFYSNQINGSKEDEVDKKPGLSFSKQMSFGGKREEELASRTK